MMKSKYVLKIVGKNPKSFLRYLYKLHIDLFSIQYQDDACLIEVDDSNYQRIKKIKTSYQITVIDRHGPIKWLHLCKRYFLFLIALILGYIVLFCLSHIIFEVEVVHTKQEIRDLVLEELKKEGISKYKWKVSFERQEQIVSDILKREKEKIEWLEIENIGTKYIVKVEERKLNQQEEEKIPQDIVAKKDGIIMKIEATSGTVIKKKNDFVKKGDIIITGVIKNQDTFMTLVPALGTVYAEVWYKSQVEMPLQYKEEYLTGQKKTVLEIAFLNHKFALFDFSSYQHSKDQIQKIVSHPLLPFSIQKTTKQELKVIDEIYTREEAVMKAMELASSKLEKRLGVNDQIISQKTLKITEKESKIIVEVFFKVKEDITEVKPIDEEKVKTENTQME